MHPKDPTSTTLSAPSGLAGWRRPPALPGGVARWVPIGLVALVATLAPPPWGTLLVLAPVAEEVVFRAGLQDTLSRRLTGRLHAHGFGANLLTAIAFAAAHMLLRPGALAGLTLLPALLIGSVYARHRRLLPCIALHALFNAAWLLWAGTSP